MTRACLLPATLLVASCGAKLGIPAQPTSAATAPVDRHHDWSWREQVVPSELQNRSTLRVVVVGDTGSDNAFGSQLIAEAGRRCNDQCDLVLWLGDNVYEHGLTQAKLPWLDGVAQQWRQAGVPHLALVLGNHDWGLYGALMGRPRAQAQLDWAAGRHTSRSSPNAIGDGHFWSADVGPVHLVGLDTTFLDRSCRYDGSRTTCSGSAVDAMADALVKTNLPVVVAGHQPWISNGKHGDAKQTRGTFGVLRDHVLDAAPLYVAGHDHVNGVFLAPDGRFLSLVLGAGSKLREVERTSPALYESAQPGFAILEVQQDQAMSVRVFDLHGTWDCRLRLDYDGASWARRDCCQADDL